MSRHKTGRKACKCLKQQHKRFMGDREMHNSSKNMHMSHNLCSLTITTQGHSFCMTPQE